jgi:type II secretory pathway pseudopilin PulG
VVELIVGIALLLVVASATFTALQAATNRQSADTSFAEEVRENQAAMARLTHDLRQATSFQSISANAIQFQMSVGGQTLNVKYTCGASDTLGSAYSRCARTQAVAPASPPSPGSTAGSSDIQHITNGSISTFCNTTGSATSGSVFFVSNPDVPNTDGSVLACDEAYEQLVGPQLRVPTYIQVLVKATAGGDQVKGGLTHLTVLQAGVFLPNSDSGA